MLKNNLVLKRRGIVLGRLTVLFFLIVCIMSTFTAQPVDARLSDYTSLGVGPMYWTVYEYCYENNIAMPIERFQANVDWVAANLRQYGVDMVCTDGWGSHMPLVRNGGIAYWVNYCNQRGLKLGIYDNPLWVARGTENDIIPGTTATVSTIINTNDTFEGWAYWVDVTKPNAETYVKSKVRELKNAGVKYYRVDFLSWYEDGIDKARVVGVNHGTQNYDTALRWIEEECGNSMQLSLVMPHLYNNAYTEMKYGDMVRVNEDAAGGTWWEASNDHRGYRDTNWSQYNNMYDGLVGLSHLQQKYKMNLDADFLRLHKLADDSERRFVLSAAVLSGGGFAVADQYDTAGGSLAFYQNSEVMGLRSQGLVCRPFSSCPRDVQSQYWRGQLPDGSWIVGLFNREDSWQTRTVDFTADLGITGNASVRDLWSHSDLGSMSGYSVNLGAHDAIVLKITPGPSGSTGPAVIKLNDAAIYGTDNYFTYNGTWAWNIDNNTFNQDICWTSQQNAYATVTFNGTGIKFYGAKGAGSGNIAVSIDNGPETTINAYSSYDQYKVLLYTSPALSSGQHTLKIRNADSGKYALVDYVEITRSSLATLGTVSNPGFESGSISGWTATGSSYGVDSADVHSGSYKCYFWNSSAYTQKIEQTVTGLANGSYTVKAWVKQNTGTPTVCRMELSNYGGSTAYANISSGSSYQQISSTVNVTNGQVNIAFYTQSPGSTNLQIDDVEISPASSYQIPLSNPGFENGNISGWTEWHPSGQPLSCGVDSADVQSGSYKCFFWGSTPYEQSIHQVVTGLTNGSYTVKAWVKQNTGTPNYCWMEVANYGGATVYANIPHGSTYNQYQLTVNVTNGQLDIGFYTGSPGNTNMQIDSVELWKN